MITRILALLGAVCAVASVAGGPAIAAEPTAIMRPDDVDALVQDSAFEKLPFNERVAALDRELDALSPKAEEEAWARLVYYKLFAMARVGDYDETSAYLRAIEDRFLAVAAGTDYFVDALYPSAFIYVSAGDFGRALSLVERMKAAPGFDASPLYRFYADNILVAIYTSIGNSVLAADILIDNLESGRADLLPELEQLKLVTNISFALVEGRQFDRVEKYIGLGQRRLESARRGGSVSEIGLLQTEWHLNSNLAHALIEQDRFDELRPIADKLTRISASLGSQTIDVGSRYVEAAAIFGEGRPADAAKMISAVIREMESLGSREQAVTFYRTEAKILSSLGRHKEAFASLTKSRSVSEITDLERIRARSEFMNAQSSLQKKNLELQKLSAEFEAAEKLRRRDRYIVVLATLGLAALSILAMLLMRSKNRLEKYAAELSESERQAQQAAHAKAAFLANMSHEIRTPLNGLMGMAQVLVDRDLTPPQRECVDIILSSGELLLTVVNDVLDLSKIEAGKMHIESIPTDLRRCLDHLVRLWAPKAAEKGLSLRLSIDDAVPAALLLDPVRLRQCIANLISNAVKFTSHGQVVVSARLATRGNVDLVEVAVSDTGVGIDEATRRRLFSAFEQADTSTTRRFGGSGLGLAITSQLADLMGGAVDVESKLGRGSTFTLRLPARPVEAARAAMPSEAAETTANDGETDVITSVNGLKILLVDDNMVNRLVVKAFLGEVDCEVVEAGNGMEALAALAVHADIGLILLDMHMPVMDGPETVRRIRASSEAWRTTPILTLTADAMAGDRDRYIEMGTDGYVSKPVVKADLFSEIERVFAADRMDRRADAA
ncbi:MAG: response regulator [Alphaproteobacteria bacterium]|nr:response regulator [Alphaproteobacteria bacterium]